jgi:hypothetical protein
MRKIWLTVKLYRIILILNIHCSQIYLSEPFVIYSVATGVGIVIFSCYTYKDEKAKWEKLQLILARHAATLPKVGQLNLRDYALE